MKNKQFIILAVVCVVTLLPFMGLTDFHTKGEPREAIVAYSMIETGNWTLPVNNGGDIAYKPPLFHWCIAALSSIAGKVTEYTSRMPSALALITMVLGGFLFYAKRRGASVALLMGLITLSNFEVHRAGMNCRVDMMLTAFIVLALYQLYRWCEKGQKGFPWIATLFMGCATLTKGPVGILLPCMVTGVFLLIRGTSFFKAFFSMALVAITSCILPALWYIAAYQQGGDNFISLVMEENFGRFMGKMSYESHENPAYYNIITVVSGYAPYTWENNRKTPRMVAEVHNIYPRNGQHPLVLFIEHCSHFRFLLHPKEQAQCLPVTHLSVHRLFPCRIYHVSGPEKLKSS